ncbi:MAG TPA: biotin--[acetyl-CoA-carboxylase] ligase [Candidatus Dormibacteraeota bacterium]|nr:biotin--[acetyl-CoA-carboxylase] ligase [Candidatus Dormibacteraeota bacterium]
MAKGSLSIVVSRRLQHNPFIKNSAKTRASRAPRSPDSKRASPTRTAAADHKQQPTDVRLGRIVRLLMEHATVVVSGTKIAQEISSNRSEVWRLIQQLRGLGVDVAGHPATGYRLRSVPDLLLPEILRPLLRGTIFEDHIHHFYKIGSTNTAAMAAAADGAVEGSVFLAEEQTTGRGRGAHTWDSARSAGIYCSTVLRPALPPSDVLVLALAAGLAVRTAIVEVNARVSIDLKWPNDVLIDGRKVCGILTEMNAEATRVRHIVVGIGINVNQADFPKELQNDATSLRIATGSEWSRVELTAALLKSLDREYRQFIEQPGARQSILRRFAEHSSWVRAKQVRIEENGTKVEGTTEGLDERGFLQVRTPQGLQTVLSGTVREVKEAISH